MKRSRAKLPRSSKAHGLLGIIRLKQEDYPRALEHLNRALEYYPGDHESLANRSVAYYFLGRVDEALQDLKSAHRIVPEDERYLRFVEQLEREVKAP